MSACCTSRRSLAWACGAALTLSIALLAIGAAGAQERPDRESFQQFPRERGPGSPGISRSFDWPTEDKAKRGFLFVDGEYLLPPYEIRYSDAKLTINDRELTCVPPARGFGARGYGSSRGADSPWRYMVSDLSSQLGNDAVVLSFENQPYLCLDSGTAHDFLKSMTTQEMRSLRQVSVRAQLPESFNKTVWDEWIESFEPPDDLKQRAAFWIANYDTTQQKAEAEIQAARWMDRLTYPLSVSSMVLIVLAIGHLLGGRPHAGQPTFGIDASPAMIRALEYSLFFAAAFSSIDLIWTILAASNNQMRELNPIGSHLIKDPRQLAGFKVGITFSCLALLWLLRKHKRAQIAAWWVCLILTLVTIRWLTFNSIFV